MSDAVHPPAARLRRVLSPEVVAGLLSLVVVAVMLPFLMQALTAPIRAIPSAPVPSDAVVGGGPTTSAGSPLKPSASATATATGSEAWESEARVLVQAATGLTDMLERLTRIAKERPIRAADIARQLRAMNPRLSATLELVEAMQANGAPSALVEAVRKPLSTALQASLETLRAALPNANAYRSGAADVIEALEPLEAVVARIEKEAGLR